MPEGPEVEVISRGLRTLIGGIITSVDTKDMKGLLRNRDEGELQSRLLSMKISGVERHGKWILFKLDDVSVCNKQALLSHLGMFGTWLIGSNNSPTPPHARLRLSVATHQGPRSLTYVDMRSWGKIYTFTYDEALMFLRGRIGVDATIVDVNQIIDLLKRDTRPICEMLLDQSRIAGIGNIYRSEILWLAKISPDRPCTDITEEETFHLFMSIRDIISRAIELRGSSIKDYRDTNGDRGEFHKFLRAYGRNGQPCARCNFVSPDPLLRVVRFTDAPCIQSTKRFDDRAVFYCPSCQR